MSFELIARSHGPNLGIVHLAGAAPIADTDELLADEDRKAQLHFFDTVFANFDRSKANPNVLRAEDGQLWYIDHDSCRLLFAAPLALPAGHLLQGTSVNPSLIAHFTPPPFWLCERLCREVPTSWSDTPPNPVRLHHLLGDRIRSYFERFASVFVA